MITTKRDTEPAARWRNAAVRRGEDDHLRLRLAAMAGHMRTDRLAARRAALIDLLADGRPHTREDIWRQVAREVGRDCWGKRADEALLRDLKALRRGGLRVAYSRQPGLEGYYLEFPALDGRAAPWASDTDDRVVSQLRGMTVAEKQAAAFAAADFALRQKRLILAQERPDWSVTQVEREARRLVFGG